MKKFIYIILGSLLFLCVLGIIYEQVSRFHYDSKKPDKDNFITIGERDIHFKKMGNGPITIVFESGLGGDHVHWQEIQKELSKKYTTLSYDRANILWSDETSEVSLERYENDLFAVLEQSGCPKPFVLVGHSFAGITLRPFIKRHQKDIVGIVFVDVAHPSQLKTVSEELRASVKPPPVWLIRFANGLGLARLLYNSTPFNSSLPKDHFFNENAANHFHRIMPGLLQEMENDEILMEKAEEIKDFGEIPLTVITAAYPNGIEWVNTPELEEEYLELHTNLQRDLLNLSTKSKQIIAQKSGHYVTFDEPGIIVDAVESLVEIGKGQENLGN
ncbi:MAG: alpha/beta hydrolase [Bacteroidota bacterium]